MPVDLDSIEDTELEEEPEHRPYEQLIENKNWNGLAQKVEFVLGDNPTKNEVLEVMADVNEADDFGIAPDVLVQRTDVIAEYEGDMIANPEDYITDEDVEDYTPDTAMTCEITHRQSKTGGLYYGKEVWRDDEQVFEPVADFGININSRLIVDGDTIYDATINPANGEKFEIQFPASAFRTPRKFRAEVVEKGDSITFQGGQSELTQLKKYVTMQDYPTRTGTDVVGLHDGELVTPNNVIDENGEVEAPDYVFIEQRQAIEDKWQADLTGDIDSEDVAEFLRHYWQTRRSERLLPVIGYVYSSLYTPQIRQQEGQIPLVNIVGETGAGKTSTMEKLYEAVGMDGNPYSARDTNFALLNALSSSNCIPIWFDEYKPSDMKKYELDRLHDYLRKTSKKGDESRGKQDQSVRTYTLQSPVVLSGEEIIQGSAEQRRSLRTQFLAKSTDDEEKKKHWAIIDGGDVMTDDGLEYHTSTKTEHHARAVWSYVLNTRDRFESEWKEAKEKVFEILQSNHIRGLDNLEIVSLTMIVHGVRTYKRFATEYDVDDLPTEEDIEDAVTYVAGKMGEANRESHVGEFIRLLAQAISEGYLNEYNQHEESPDYKIVCEDRPNERLAVDIDKALPKVRRYVEDHHISTDLLDKPSAYKSRFDEYDYIEKSKDTTGMRRCTHISTNTAEAVVDGFDRSLITVEN